MKVHAAGMLLLALAMLGNVPAQPVDVTGQWVEPTGSAIRVDRCGQRICMWIIALGPKAPSKLDIYNPDPAKRARPLCGLQIGSGFVAHTPDVAQDGTLYDPKSGKTYHGLIKLDGNRLQLRGYVGIPLFGESQTWTRPAAPVANCMAESKGK
jgi:uncharacterized protein (DUF2147 family)